MTALGSKQSTAIYARLKEPDERLQSFSKVNEEITSGQFSELEFSEVQIENYRAFSDLLFDTISKINKAATYEKDISTVISRLKKLHTETMLELNVPEPTKIAKIFVDGSYYYQKRVDFPTKTLKDFVLLFTSVTTEKQSIILGNIFTKLDSVNRYFEPNLDDEIPF